MAITRGGKVQETADALLAFLDEEFGPEQKIGTVVIVVEIMDRTENRVTSYPVWLGDDDREWVQRALLEETLATSRAVVDEEGYEEDDD